MEAATPVKQVNVNEIIRESDINISFDDSGYNFHENFKRVDKEDDVWLYIDYGNLSDTVNYDVLPRQKTKVINAMLQEFEGYFEKKELQELDTDTLYDWFVSTCYDYGDTLEYLDICSKYNIKTERDNYVEYSLIGYSQGDRVTVIVNRKEAEECWGNSLEAGLSKEYLHELFYDSPLTVRIDILDDEFISEQDGSYEEFDKDKFIDEVIENFKDEFDDVDFLKEQLEELVPFEPSHN